jgi:hypothetical protein
MSFDWKRLSTLDRVIAGGGAVAFVAAFLPWYGASVGPFSASVDGWSAGFTAWAGSLLLTAAAVLLVVLRSGGTLPSIRTGPSVLVAGVSGLGLLLVVVRWASLPRVHSIGGVYSAGARYGLYVALIAGIAEVAAAVMEMRASDEELPWAAQDGHDSEPTEPGPEAPPAARE